MNILDFKYEDLQHIKGWMSPYDCMIEVFGDEKTLLECVNAGHVGLERIHRTTAHRWKRGQPIHHAHQYRIMQAAYKNSKVFATECLISGKIKYE